MKILHLYYDLMNLYGDWANAAVLARELNARGYAAEVDKKSVGDDVDFNAYDFIYIGSGTERSLHACVRCMEKHKDALIGRIEDGVHVLATGNSHEMFGRTIRRTIGTTAGEPYEALGLLDYETVQGNARVTGDCVCRASFLDERLIGFINRASDGQQGGIERPFVNELGPGANDTSRAEGIKYKNLLGTYLTGPILVRNPTLLRYIADKLAGETGGETGDGSLSHLRRDREPSPVSPYQEEAYRLALAELSARI